jgi:hypothetical protein
MSDRAHSIFRNACVYSKAARFLNCGPDLSLILPSQVIAALSLELLFKALFFIETGTDFKIDGRHSHDFHNLYKRLDNSLRDKLKSRFDQSIKERAMNDVRAMERRLRRSISLDFDDNLKQWSEIFVEARYPYDLGGGTQMMFFPEIEDAILSTIYEMNPEWKTR